GRVGSWGDIDARVVERAPRITGGGVDRDAFLDHELLIEPAVGAAAEDMGKHLDRLALTRLGSGVGRHQVVALHARLPHAWIGERHRTRSLVPRLLRAHAYRHFRDTPQPAGRSPREPPSYVSGNGARDDAA